MELVLPMYNAYPYFSLTDLGKEVYIVHGKIWYFEGDWSLNVYELIHKFL